MELPHSADQTFGRTKEPSHLYRAVKDPLAEYARKVTIENPQGLHARPAMRFVDIAGQFQSSILVKKGNRVVDGKNPMEMMLLEATQGTELELRAEGPDAAAAIEALADLVAGGFGEM